MPATDTKFLEFKIEDKVYRADFYIYASGNVVVNIRGEFDDSAFWANGTPKFFKGRIACFQLINSLPSDTTKPEPTDRDWRPFYNVIQDDISQIMEWF